MYQSYGYTSKFNMKTSNGFPSNSDDALFPNGMILAFPDLDAAPKQFDAFTVSESLNADEDSFTEEFGYVTFKNASVKRLTVTFLVMMIISALASIGLIIMYFQQSDQKSAGQQELQTPALTEEQVLKETYNQVFGITFKWKFQIKFLT